MAGERDAHAQYASGHAVVLIVFSVLACIAVTLRLWARNIQNLPLSLSDYTLLLGLVFTLGESGINIFGCCLPESWATYKPNAQAAQALSIQLSFISPLVWVVAVTLVRASITFLYIHIFPKRSFRLACYAVLVVNMLYLASMIMAECLICRPIAFRWDHTIRGGSCGDQKALSLYGASVNLAQDIVLVILPMPVLWGLQMATRRKVALSCIFGIGIAICAVTSYRVYVTSTIADPSSAQSQEAYALIALTAGLETLLGIITACMPMLTPVGKRIWSSLPKSSKSNVSTVMTAAGSVVARAKYVLRLPPMEHGPRSFIWFSADSDSCGTKVDRKCSDEGPLRPEKDDVKEMKIGQIYVRNDVDLESVRK